MTVTARQRLLLIFILTLAGALRFYRIGDSCFWLDEFLSAECAAGRGYVHATMPRDVWLTDHPPSTTMDGALPIWHIWNSLKMDVFPPLYYIALRAWENLFGSTDAAARSLSVACSVGMIALYFDAVKTGLGPTTALWAALLAAVALPQIHYGQEARCYALWEMLGMGACAAMMRLEVLGVTYRRCAMLALCTLGMVLTHYLAVGTSAALGLYALIALRGRARNAAILSLVIAGGLFLLVWGPQFLDQRGNMAANTSWEQDLPAGHLKLTIGRVAILPVRWCSEKVAQWQPGVSTAIGAIAFLLVITRFRGRWRLWCLWMILPPLFAAAIDTAHTTKLLDAVRYAMAGSLGFFVLLCGWGDDVQKRLRRDKDSPAAPPSSDLAARNSRWPSYVMPAIVAIVCLATVPYAYSDAQDWSRLGVYLQQNVTADDAIVFSNDSWDYWYSGALYVGLSHYAGPLPAPMILMNKPLSPELMQKLRQRRYVWLIAGSQRPSEELVPGFAVIESTALPDIGKAWQLRPR